MGIYIGAQELSTIKLGAQECEIYLGAEKLYPTGKAPYTLWSGATLSTGSAAEGEVLEKSLETTADVTGFSRLKGTISHSWAGYARNSWLQVFYGSSHYNAPSNTSQPGYINGSYTTPIDIDISGLSSTVSFKVFLGVTGGSDYSGMYPRGECTVNLYLSDE